MTAPPPMPNRPARMPVTTPPAMIAAASQRSSPSGTPEIIESPGSVIETRSRRDVRHIGTRVQYERNRLAQDRNAGAGLDRMRREVATERARAGHRVEQAEQVSRH